MKLNWIVEPPLIPKVMPILMLSLMGYCGYLKSQEPTLKAATPVYLRGTVKGENFVQDPIRYTFSVETDRGLKVFWCNGDYASTLDTLINPGDKIKIKLPSDDEIERRQFPVLDETIVEINGQPSPL